jgi:hypothetical protein
MRNPNYNQVCVAIAFPVKDFDPEFQMFTHFMEKVAQIRIQPLEVVETYPNRDEFGMIIPDTGGRKDLIFAIHDNDVDKFAIARKLLPIFFIEEALGRLAGKYSIYPTRLRGYVSFGIAWEESEDDSFRKSTPFVIEMKTNHLH